MGVDVEDAVASSAHRGNRVCEELVAAGRRCRIEIQRRRSLDFLNVLGEDVEARHVVEGAMHVASPLPFLRQAGFHKLAGVYVLRPAGCDRAHTFPPAYDVVYEAGLQDRGAVAARYRRPVVFGAQRLVGSPARIHRGQARGDGVGLLAALLNEFAVPRVRAKRHRVLAGRRAVRRAPALAQIVGGVADCSVCGARFAILVVCRICLVLDPVVAVTFLPAGYQVRIVGGQCAVLRRLVVGIPALGLGCACLVTVKLRMPAVNDCSDPTISADAVPGGSRGDICVAIAGHGL